MKRKNPGPKPLKRENLDDPKLFINRELSWLEFNNRVLLQGLDETVPLLERLKFLAIVSSNLDEFFMIRVAGLKQQQDAGLRRRGIQGMTPTSQINAIAERTHRLVFDQTQAIRQILDALNEHGIHVLEPNDLTDNQRRFLQSYFEAEILPVLTPLAVEQLESSPELPGLEVMLGVRLESPGSAGPVERIVVVPVPRSLPRFIALPAQVGLNLVRLEDGIGLNTALLFPSEKMLARVFFRITRDADVSIQDDSAADLLDAVEKAVRARRGREPVRLEISARPDRILRTWLLNQTRLVARDLYEIDGMLDASALMEIANRPGFDGLKASEWPPQPPPDLLEEQSLWESLQERDVLLFHPYESFDPVVRLIELAAEDPNVLAIKQTLYRTSGNSPIIVALEKAARSGKQVIVLVELKARFDEERNVNWARRLEEAGAFVIYGIAGYKTHSKALLIVRRDSHGVRRYVHLSTGNYNDRTARLYSDIGLMTSDRELAADTAAFFNLLTGLSEAVGWSKLSIAPGGLRHRFNELIDREIDSSTPEQPGLIEAKVNSLQDKEICKALYRASQAGVRIRLNVRGICCLRPGIPGVSDHIEVHSIVDRFLEHARIFHFRNGGHDEVYLSSADWMTRNLDKRLEILFPVLDPRHANRLITALNVYMQDNVKAYKLQPDGTYSPVEKKGKPVRAQEHFYNEAVNATKLATNSKLRFRPLTRPES